MNRDKTENLKIRQKYIEWLQETGELSKSSANKAEAEIYKFEKYLGNKNLKKLTKELIIKFKEELKNSGVAISTYSSTIRSVRKFLNWLASQNGYKSRLTPSLIKYMNLSREDKSLAQISEGGRTAIPIESVYKLLDSITTDDPIGLRDRAIVSLLVTTGIRHKALVTLPMGCVHLSDGYINQNPAKGVDTKSKKWIKSAICPVDAIFTQCLSEWYSYLRQNGFKDSFPFIPRTKVSLNHDTRLFEKGTEVEPQFWKSHRSLTDALRKRFSQAGLPYHSPHCFRHCLTKTVKELNLTSKQSKCFSQSLGHEHEDTTYGCYGKFSEEEVISTVRIIDFQQKDQSEETKINNRQEIEEIVEEALNRRKNELPNYGNGHKDGGE